MSEAKIALVTGISSGIGRASAELLIENGYRVFGTVRSPAAEAPSGVVPIIMDIRDERSVELGVARVLSEAGRLDVLVNNAGVTVVGAIEETELVQAQALFDVNFFGAVRVTRAVLPSMRRQRSGRIVFVSSVLGFLPAPYMGFYAASKHALEGYAETLDHEVRAFGIRTVLVEPGFMKTKLDRNSTTAARDIEDYRPTRARVGAAIGASVEQGDDPTSAAGAILDAVGAEHPKLRYPVGKNAGTLAALRNFLPSGWFDRSFRRRFHLDA